MGRGQGTSGGHPTLLKPLGMGIIALYKDVRFVWSGQN